MRKGASNSLILAVPGIAIIAGIYFFIGTNGGTLNLDAFAQCLQDKGAVFYGASWCSHCQKQKAMFGKSAKYLPYVECSENGLALCIEKKIDGYPTWEFADGSRLTGEIPLLQLSEKTGCELPQ
ncbi:MAG: hypothetical protein HYV55_00700 [Parcubacteria group bacterium]|nr:hypothetical protein [Parcubacteria group bacterium]